MHLLYPFSRNIGEHDHLKWQQSLLERTAHLGSNSGRSDVLAALTWPYGPKFVIIYGTTAADSRTSPESTQDKAEKDQESLPALIVAITSSPLWCLYKTGKRDNFLVGEAHMLIELAPQPRILWHCAKDIKYADIIDITVQDEIRFRDHGTNSVDATASSSGLCLNFNTSLATLNSAQPDVGKHKSGYVELSVGPHHGPPRTLDGPQAWSTVVRMKRIEVYNNNKGVSVGLSVRDLD